MKFKNPYRHALYRAASPRTLALALAGFGLVAAASPVFAQSATAPLNLDLGSVLATGSTSGPSADLENTPGTAPYEAPPPPAPKPVPIPPKPVTPPMPVPPLPAAPPIPMPPPPSAAHHITRHVEKSRPHVQMPTPVKPAIRLPTVAAALPVPVQPPAPPAPTGGQVDLFSAAIKRALQAHANAVYPPAAQMSRQGGSPELTFTYLNGIVTNISLSRSCGFPLLDAAALQDARIASYPPPPPGFAGRIYHITVTVDFQIAAPTVDGD